MTVGDRLAPGAQVRPDAERLPAAAHVEAQAAADVVEDQGGADPVADGAHALGELRVGVLEVALDVVADRSDHDGRDVVRAGLGDGGLERREVVVLEVDACSRGPRGSCRAPPGASTSWRCRGRSRARSAPCAARVADRATTTPSVVASVPFLQNMAQSACGTWSTKRLGQLDHERGRAVQDVADRGLLGGRLVDLRVPVAEQVGTPRAHEVDVLVAVDVPDPTALAALEELRELRRQEGGIEMPVHAAGNDTRGARTKRRVDLAGALGGEDAHGRAFYLRCPK